MKLKLFFTVGGLIIFCNWTLQPKNEIQKAEWLIGTWENKTSRGSIYENWTRVSTKEFSGKSYMLKGKDTVVFETIRLVSEHDGLFYIPVVKDQNGGSPVRFALKGSSDSSLVFENQGHDFPQKISYTKINKDALLAEISGTKGGKERKQQFPMKRVK